MKRLFAAPRIIYDETITSWVYRCAYSSECYSLTVPDIDDIVPKFTPRRVGEDRSFANSFDFDISLEPVRKVVAEFHIPEEIIGQVFGSGGKVVLGAGYCTSYCPECLDEDVVKYGLPVWRKSWCYVHSPFCLKHRALLRTGDDFSQHKAWKAFQLEISGKELSFATSGQRYLSRVRDLLAMRVQRWIDALYVDLNTSCLALVKQPFADEVISCLCIFLRKILKAGSPRAEPGIARGYLSRERVKWICGNASLRTLEEKGWILSTPYQRMTALLLIGQIFGLFSEKEVAWIVSYARSLGWVWPSSLKTIAHDMFESTDIIDIYTYMLPFSREAKSKEAIELVSPILSEMVENYRSKTRSDYPVSWQDIRRPVNYEILMRSRYLDDFDSDSQN